MHITRRFIVQIETTGDGKSMRDGHPLFEAAAWRLFEETRRACCVEDVLGVEFATNDPGYSVQVEELDLTAQPEPEPTVTDLAKLTDRQHAMLLAACRYMEAELKLEAESLAHDVWGIATNEHLYPAPTEEAYSDLGDLLSGLTPEPTAAQSEDDAEFVEYARERFHRDGELEFDDVAQVSRGDDNGAYVACWKWVEFPESEDEIVNREPACAQEQGWGVFDIGDGKLQVQRIDDPENGAPLENDAEAIKLARLAGVDCDDAGNLSNTD